MTFAVLTSISGAPGVSTTAVAWAYSSTRPTLVVESDVTGGSPVTATVWAGHKVPDVGLLDLAGRAPDRYVECLWESALVLPGTTDRWVVPTIGYPSQAGSLASVWSPLADALSEISRGGGVDVVVDAGRLGTPGGPWTLVDRADVVLVLTDVTLAALSTTAIGLTELRDALARTGPRDRLVAVPVLGQTPRGGGIRPYGPAEVTKVLAPTPVLPGIPRDERAATGPAKPGGYTRAVRRLADAAAAHAGQTRQMLDPMEATS